MPTREQVLMALRTTDDYRRVGAMLGVPPGQAYVPIESPKGELACHVVSDGGTRPYRAHLRDPSFHHMQAVSVLWEGGNLADVIPAIASIDPVIGGVDR